MCLPVCFGTELVIFHDDIAVFSGSSVRHAHVGSCLYRWFFLRMAHATRRQKAGAKKIPGTGPGIGSQQLLLALRHLHKERL
jgi:hypothetical protein